MKADTKSFYREVVQATIERIAGGLDEALDLEACARAAGLSPFHFHRVFRGMVGETPLELARRL
jgi:AraC family transcriptional regulator